MGSGMPAHTAKEMAPMGGPDAKGQMQSQQPRLREMGLSRRPLPGTPVRQHGSSAETRLRAVIVILPRLVPDPSTRSRLCLIHTRTRPTFSGVATPTHRARRVAAIFRCGSARTGSTNLHYGLVDSPKPPSSRLRPFPAGLGVICACREESVRPHTLERCYKPVQPSYSESHTVTCLRMTP